MSRHRGKGSDKSLRFRYYGYEWEAWAERDGEIWRVTVLREGRDLWVTYRFPGATQVCSVLVNAEERFRREYDRLGGATPRPAGNR